MKDNILCLAVALFIAAAAGMLAIDPAARLTPAEALRSPFLTAK